MTSAENKQLVRHFFDAGSRVEIECRLGYLAGDDPTPRGAF